MRVLDEGCLLFTSGGKGQALSPRRLAWRDGRGQLSVGPVPRRSPNICPRYQAAIEVLGKRWTGLVLNVVMNGPLRFSEIASRLEVVSDRVLSERLKELEAEGILERRATARGVVQYRLTRKGRAMGAVVGAIERWASRWVALPRGADR
jgi:DNA-binding HxlR family transcriptional regulator